MTQTNIRQITVAVFLATAALYFAKPMWAADYKDMQSPDAHIPSFSQLDLNKDGFIDSKEAGAAPALLKVWVQADTDKDGKLSPEEFAAITSSK